MVLSLL